MNASAAAHIRALVCGYAPRLWGRKNLLMLNAFFDDSGSEFGDRNFFLAGYLNSASAWIGFAKDWDRALRRKPAIPYLHMVEANGLRDTFGGWKPEVRDKKILRLARVIHKHKPTAFHVYISRKTIDEVLAPIMRKSQRDPYQFCFWSLIPGVLWHQYEQNNRTPIDFIFDEQGEIGRDAVAWYYEVKSWFPEIEHLYGSTPVFKSDHRVAPLQAADMFAWHIRRMAERPEEGTPSIWQFLRNDERHFFSEIDADQVKGIADRAVKSPHHKAIQSDPVPWKKRRKSLRRALLSRADKGPGDAA